MKKEDFSKEKFEKLRKEWHYVRDSEARIDYNLYINRKIHRRWVMKTRADDISYRKRNLIKKKLISLVKDDINEEIAARAKRVKVVLIDGILTFLDIGDERYDLY